MKLRAAHFESDRVATISRALVENALRMRCMAFLSQVKMSVLLDTLHEDDEPIDYMRQIRDSVVADRENWRMLPVKISEEARELQQMTLAMERRREELRHFLADQMKSLHRSETRFQQLFDLIPDAVGIHQRGLWVFANPAAATSFGADSPEQLIGTPVLERVHPDDRDKVLGRIREQVAQGGKAPLVVERLIRLDGSMFWAEVQGCPFEQDGEPCVLVMMRDVTTRIEAERKNRHLRQAVDQSAEPMMLMNAAGVIEMANPAAAALYSLTEQQLVGRYAAELRGGQRGDHQYREVVGAVQAGHVWQGEIEINTAHGPRILSRRVSPVFDENGMVERQICVDRDITEERLQQQQLEHTQRLESLGILAGGIAHDFNNILTAIMGNAAMAGRQMKDTAPAKMFLSRIEAASQRASELCKQMLAYSGKGQFVIKAVNLSEIVHDMARLMEVSIRKNVVIKYDLTEQLPAVEADEAQLQQVILNLITNANEAIGDSSGVIAFSSGVMQADDAYLAETISPEHVKPGRYVFLEVSDSGCGMDAKTMKKMFDPFFTTKFTGRGLGMSAVLGIVRGHHGALRVYSEPGKGTTFKILLPASDQQIAGEQLQGVDSAHDAQGTILVVDDEETIREVAAMMLEDAGFAVLTAENGLQALDVYRDHQHEIAGVLMDMTMPKMDGKACFRELRRINADVQVVLSSGYNEQDATSRFAGKGLAGFIQKPYSPEALKTLALETWGRQKEA